MRKIQQGGLVGVRLEGYRTTEGGQGRPHWPPYTLGWVAVLKYLHFCFPFAKWMGDADEVSHPKPTFLKLHLQNKPLIPLEYPNHKGPGAAC